MINFEGKKNIGVMISIFTLLLITVIIGTSNVRQEPGEDDYARPLLGKWEVYDSGPGWSTIEFLGTGKFIIDGLPRTLSTNMQIWWLEDSNTLFLRHNSIASNRLPFYVSDDGDVLVLTYPARDIYFIRVR